MQSNISDALPPAHSHGGLIRIGFGLEELGRWGLKAPWITVALLVVLTIGAAISGRGVGFEDNLYEIYRSDGDEFTQYSTMAELFPATHDKVIAVVEGPGVTTREGLELLRDVHLELAWVDGAYGVTSIFSVRERAEPGGSPTAVVPADIPEGADLDALLERLENHPLAGPRLLSLDPPATLIVATIDPAFDAFDVAPSIVDTMNAIFADRAEAAGLDVKYTGAPLLRLEILSSLRHDQAVLNAAGTIISFIVCLTFFGRWRFVLTAVVPGLVGVIWTIGSFALVGQTINVMNSVLPTLVTVIAMADALHMTSAVRRALAEGLSAPQAARRAVEEVGPACAMTMLTTALVFLALATSSSVAIRDFGFAGAFAAFLAYVSVILLVPAVSALLMRAYENRTDLLASGGILARITTSATAGSSRLVTRRPRTVAAVGTLLLGLATVAYFSVPASYTYREFLPDRSQADRAIDRIDELFTGADTVQVLVTRTGEAQPGAPRPADVIRSVHEITDSVEGLSYVDSIATLEDWVGRDLSDWTEGLSEEEDLGLPPHVISRYRSEDGTAWMVTASLPAIDAHQSVPMFDALDKALEPVRAEAPGYDIFVTGVVPMTAISGIELIRSLNWSLIAAIVVTMALIGLALRSLVTGLMVALPNLLPLAVVGAALYVTGQGMQITSVVALTIAFGLAVDDTVHLVHRWQIERRHASARNAAIEALEHVGPVLIATTMVLVSGMVATQISALPMVRLFGGLCMLTFVAALMADLLLMPALLVSFSRLFPERPKE